MEIISFKTIALLITLMATVLGLNAQSLKSTDDLYKEIQHQDSVLFDAFNTKNLAVIKETLAPDLEFYHDKTGRTNYEENLAVFKTNFDRNVNVHRTLVPGSMEVYPVSNYGAMQIAAHTFCHTENGKEECGTFKFVHIWHKTPQGWKLARVVSYGH